MNHWGKIIGGILGYLVGGLPGVPIGLLLGAFSDKYIKTTKPPTFTQVSPQILVGSRKEFIAASFSVLGYLSRSSGNLDGKNYGYAGHVLNKMNWPKEKWREVLRLYEEGKEPEFSLHSMVGTFYVACRDQPVLMEMFLEILLYAVLVDGEMSDAEQNIILNICYQLDFTTADFERLVKVINNEYHQARLQQNNKSNKRASKEKLRDAYAILNTTPDASDKEVTLAYRRLTSKHHPDKLVSKGLPDEMLKVAEVKTREIRAAYERIRATRDS